MTVTGHGARSGRVSRPDRASASAHPTVKHPVRIGLVVSTLAMGGTERAVTTLANYWVGRGHEVRVFTLSGIAADFYSLDKAVERHVLGLDSTSNGLLNAVWGNLRRVWRLRRALRAANPDVVVSFLTDVNVLTLLAARGLSVPVLVAERTDPRRHVLPASWVRLRRLLYPWADRVIVQTPPIAEWAATVVDESKVVVIANAVTVRRPETPVGCSIDRQATVAAMGRLTWAKGFDVLLRAFAACAALHPAWNLILIGDGEERERLGALARTLGIQDRVLMVGRMTRPEVTLRQAGVFVLPSRYEGFPNALLEAMACGTPTIATEYAPGSESVVRHGVDGLLVPVDDVEALAAALSRLMGDADLRANLGRRASDVIERFSFEKIMAEWDRALDSVVASGQRLDFHSGVAGSSNPDVSSRRNRQRV